MPTKIDRRKFVSGSAVLLGAAVAGVACGSGDKQSAGSGGAPRSQVPTVVHRLDHCVGDCKACKACKLHAENKYFANQAAIVLAHPGCNCGVKTQNISPDDYANLFLPADAPPRTNVDARWPWVASILS